MRTRFPGRALPPVLAAVTLAAMLSAGCSRHGQARADPASVDGAGPAAGTAGPAPSPTGPYAAPLPRPLVLAQGVSSANAAHRFRSQAWDFTRMRAVFDAVSLLPGDQQTVHRARAAGLAVVLEFDYKDDFFAGRDISAEVQAVVRQVRASPGTISAIDVADRLNQDYSTRQGLRYLAATGGVFHRELPGVPVVVNAPDTQLTCGMPGQSSCAHPDPGYRYETNATLDAFAGSGYVDGLIIADNLKNNDAAVQIRAWRYARTRWPRPLLLWSTCSELSFPGRRPPGPAASAALVAAFMTAPARGGAGGLALWAWHQLYDGSIYTFLDKDGSGNGLWRDMTSAAASLGLARATGRPESQRGSHHA